MCLILFAYHRHPDYPLIVAANRDEFFTRPTRPAHFWDNHPSVLGGLDLQAGGTWMGITRQGRFAAVTNYREAASSIPARDPADIHGNSRGELTRDFLLGSAPPEVYIRNLVPHACLYRGFSLLVGDRHSLYYYSNRSGPPRKLSPGVYGLSNNLLNVPWPKVRCGKDALEQTLSETVDEERLMSILNDKSPAPDSELPHTGVSLEWERELSPRFIRAGKYGTRSSTLLIIDAKGQVRFTERSYETDNGLDGGCERGEIPPENHSCVSFAFSLER